MRIYIIFSYSFIITLQCLFYFMINLVDSFHATFMKARVDYIRPTILFASNMDIADFVLDDQITGYSSSSSKSKNYVPQKQSHSNNQYQSKLKGYNKYYHDNRKRQFETVLLIVRNQTRSRVAFTVTDVRYAVLTNILTILLMSYRVYR